MVEQTKAAKAAGSPAAGAKAGASSNGGSTGVELEREMDRLSLEKAVKDFEIANVRVVDLTQRLITANERIVELQRNTDALQTAHTELLNRHAAMTESTAYGLAHKMWTLRNLMRR